MCSHAFGHFQWHTLTVDGGQWPKHVVDDMHGLPSMHVIGMPTPSTMFEHLAMLDF